MKYDPLERKLAAVPSGTSVVRLSFSEIEQALGDSLPPSATTYREWWANQTNFEGRPQARAWTLAGFEVAEVDQTVRWVTFQRRKQ